MPGISDGQLTVRIDLTTRQVANTQALRLSIR